MREPNHDKLNELVGKLVGDLGASLAGASILLGDRLGLYKAMADGAPVTSAELAKKTGPHERYVREWLSGQAAAGYVDYDAVADTFSLSPEQAMVFADEGSPAFMAGAFDVMQAIYLDEPKVAEAFRTGEGVGWHEHIAMPVPRHRALLPAGLQCQSGVELDSGARRRRGEAQGRRQVADVGCGHGASTVLMAQAYPKSSSSASTIMCRRSSAPRRRPRRPASATASRFDVGQRQGLSRRRLRSGHVLRLPARHGRPGRRRQHVHETLAKDGTWMIVEPFAHDHLEDNLNPVGRVFYAASTMICTPASLSQEVALGLGAQAGERRLRQVATEAGFTRFRRAAETPFNMIFEARA